MSPHPSPGPAGEEPGAAGRLLLRDPLPTDEAEALAAQAELAEDGFDFLLGRPGLTWAGYLDRVARDRAGVDLPPGFVPATMLFAVVDGRVVGRVHVRHSLTPALLELGGHIGYGVRPAYRRRGHATEMLRQGLAVAGRLGVTRALVTCDDDNPGSIRTIERCGGLLEDTRRREGDGVTRRYWIDLT